MSSKREQVLSALFARVQTLPQNVVGRNIGVPQSVPNGGLIIMRDGEPGEPCVTLCPRTEFYAHRVEFEVFVPQPAAGGGEAALDALVSAVRSVLVADTSLGGLCDNLTVEASEVSVVPSDGATSVLVARFVAIVEYTVN